MKKQVVSVLICIIAICIFSLTGCPKHKDRFYTEFVKCSNDFKVLYIDKISERQLVDSIIQSYYYLPLQTTDSCLIGKIDKLIFHDDKVFILDKTLTKSIFVYGMNGKFVYKINKVGNGPGEYDNIQDFEYDSLKNQIIVICTNMRKLICYDPENGSFLMEKKLNSAPLSFVILNSNKYLFDCRLQLMKTDEDCMLKVADSLGNTISGYFPYTNYTSKEKTPFSRYNESVYYCSNYCDTLFAFQHDSLLKKYYIDFGSHKLNVSQLPKKLYTSRGVLKSKIVPYLNSERLNEYAKKEGIAFHVSSFMESDSIIKFNFIFSGKFYVALYNKNSGNVKTYSTLVQGENICFDFITFSVYKNNFVGVVSSDILAQTLTKRRISRISQNNLLKKTHLPDSITEYDNPMLIFIRYRNF